MIIRREQKTRRNSKSCRGIPHVQVESDKHIKRNKYAFLFINVILASRFRNLEVNKNVGRVPIMLYDVAFTVWHHLVTSFSQSKDEIISNVIVSVANQRDFFTYTEFLIPYTEFLYVHKESGPYFS